MVRFNCAFRPRDTVTDKTGARDFRTPDFRVCLGPGGLNAHVNLTPVGLQALPVLVCMLGKAPNG